MTHPNPYIDALLWGGWRWGESGGASLTYYFGSMGVDLPASGQTSEVWIEPEKQAVRDALQTWANVANLTFTETFSYDSANLVEFVYSDQASGTLGQHETPEHASTSDGSAWGEFNAGVANWFSSLGQGGDSFQTLVHEFGHALGLAHPHDTGGGSGLFPGVSLNEPFDLGDFNLNQGIFTTMSYNQGWVDGPMGSPEFDWYGRQAGPMAFDIAAIQYLYGANATHQSGNTTYVLPDSAYDTAWRCIWDAGGTDQIVYNGTKDTLISLIAATLDASATGGGMPSYASGVCGGYTIANGVTVENAIGGLGSDTVIGNAGSNSLFGRAGDDVIYGGSGNDVLVGGKGADKLFGGTGKDTASYTDVTKGVAASLAKPGSNTGDAKGDTFSNVENIIGGKGADALTGNTGINLLNGGAGDDRLNGNKGADDLWGGKGKDAFVFAKASDSTVSSKGRDTIYDFTKGDRFDLSAIDASTKAKGNQAFSFAGNDKFGGKAGELRYDKAKSDTYIYADTNGDKKADFGFQLDDAVKLAKADFLL